ncbi:MAG: hypothetical protein JWQ09_5754 [Segetibacter sp.]|nr:hypothetical protein [Segetibacter sp.]
MTQIRKIKKEIIIYCIALTLLSIWFLVSGFLEITRNPKVWEKTISMGYPPYFIVLLGYVKILGIIVLLIPKKLNALKEWVFAGLIFDVVFAFASGYHLGNPGGCVIPFIAFLLILFTYVMFRRINPVLFSILKLPLHNTI